MTRIEVDFNSRDDAGLLPAAPTDSDGPVMPGQAVELFDDEGNRCLATVIASGDSLALAPIWQTFAGPDQSRLVVSNGVMRAMWRNPLTVLLSWPPRLRQVVSTTATSARPEVTYGGEVLAR